MSLEKEFQDRLLGVTPTYEAQLQYAAIFRVSPELAFKSAYIDGWLASAEAHQQIIQQLIKKAVEEKECNI